MWTGTWNTTYGKIILTQTGKKVSGKYIKGRGEIKGEVDSSGKILTGIFTNTIASRNGNFIFNLKSKNSFEGKWGWSNSRNLFSIWNGNLETQSLNTPLDARTTDTWLNGNYEIFSSPNKLTRFILHTTEDTPDDVLLKSIDVALGKVALNYIPNLLKINNIFWDKHKVDKEKLYSFDYKTKKMIKRDDTSFLLNDNDIRERKKLAESNLPPKIPFLVDEILPQLKDDFPNLPLSLTKHKFFILVIPIYVEEFAREVCNLNGTLFDISYMLKSEIDLISVSPDIEYEYIKFLSSDEEKDCPRDTNKNWHLENIKFKDVPNSIDGSGIRIGHIDTGWTKHPELNFSNGRSESFDLTSDINIFDANSGSAEEKFHKQDSLAYQHYHGTSTSGLMISSHSTDGGVEGVSTGAKIVSIRAINSVVRVGTISVTLAMAEALKADVHIISLSLGGIPLASLEWLIKIAVANNIIVVAAAGNYNNFPNSVPNIIVAPASYSDCIAVGGSTIYDLPWDGSAHNIPLLFSARLDISAPSECVHVPTWDVYNKDIVNKKGRGTSYSTAIVAGAAALWLQNFNRVNLINQLNGGNTLQELFRAHLKETARTPNNWNTLIDGPGILDLSKLLDESFLPNPSNYPFPSIIYELDNYFGIDLDASSGNRFSLPSWVPVVFGDNVESIFDQAGEELITLMLTCPELVSSVDYLGEKIEEIEELEKQVVEEVKDVIDEVVEVVEDTVEIIADAITSTASSTVKKILGWFS